MNPYLRLLFSGSGGSNLLTRTVSGYPGLLEAADLSLWADLPYGAMQTDAILESVTARE